MAIAVVVDEAATRAPSMRVVAQPGRLRHVSESAVAIVAVKQVLPPSGNEEVLEAVVVVVADADAAAPAVVHQPGLLCDIGKAAVAVVVIEAVGGVRRARAEGVAREYE